MKIILLFTAGLLVTFAWLVHATTTSRPEPTTTAVVEPATPRARPSVPRFDVSAPSVTTPAPRDESELTIADQRTRLEDRFAAERPDAAWATTAQQEIRGDLERFATRDVGISDVQCRASLCRVELALATRDAASELMESWLRKRTWTGPGVADNDVVGADGKPRMVMFLGKAGLDL